MWLWIRSYAWHVLDCSVTGNAFGARQRTCDAVVNITKARICVRARARSVHMCSACVYNLGVVKRVRTLVQSVHAPRLPARHQPRQNRTALYNYELLAAFSGLRRHAARGWPVKRNIPRAYGNCARERVWSPTRYVRDLFLLLAAGLPGSRHVGASCNNVRTRWRDACFRGEGMLHAVLDAGNAGWLRLLAGHRQLSPAVYGCVSPP